MEVKAGDNKTINLSDDNIVSIMKFNLDRGETVQLTVTGHSMEPYLKEGRDKVFLRRIDTPPKKGDIVFFKRKSNAYVLHRVVKVKSDGWYFAADSHSGIEGPVTLDSMIAVSAYEERDGRLVRSGSPLRLYYRRIRGMFRKKRRVSL